MRDRRKKYTKKSFGDKFSFAQKYFNRFSPESPYPFRYDSQRAGSSKALERKGEREREGEMKKSGKEDEAMKNPVNRIIVTETGNSISYTATLKDLSLAWFDGEGKKIDSRFDKRWREGWKNCK